MPHISTDRKKELLKQVIWDYDVPAEMLLKILEGEEEQYSHIDRNYLINRCFNYLNWYQFVSLFVKEELLDALQEINYDSDKYNAYSKSTISGLDFAKRFLRKKA